MSTKSERRRAREKEKRKKTIRESIIAAALGIIIIILGIIGIRIISKKYNGYKNSDDKRVVEASIESVEVHSRKNEYDRTEYYYDTKVSFEVDGKTYSGSYEFANEVSKGDTRKVEVYLTEDGDYKTAEVTSEFGYKIYMALLIFVICIGAFFVIAGIFVALPDNDKKRK